MASAEAAGRKSNAAKVHPAQGVLRGPPRYWRDQQPHAGRRTAQYRPAANRESNEICSPIDLRDHSTPLTSLKSP